MDDTPPTSNPGLPHEGSAGGVGCPRKVASVLPNCELVHSEGKKVQGEDEVVGGQDPQSSSGRLLSKFHMPGSQGPEPPPAVPRTMCKLHRCLLLLRD